MLGVLSGLQGWHGLQYCNAMEYGRATMQAGLVEQVTSVTHVQAAHLSLRETLRGLNKRRRIRRMRRVVVAGAESARTALSRGGFRTDCLFLTLTYRWDYQWQPTQVAWFLKRLKAFCARAGVAVRYQWVLELTQRGGRITTSCSGSLGDSESPSPISPGSGPMG